MMLDTQQKAMALDALAEISVMVRCNGSWYVHQNVGVSTGDGTLIGRYGNGVSPQAAIDDHWDRVTGLAQGEYLVARTGGRRRAIRWNGYMWADVTEYPDPTEAA